MAQSSPSTRRQVVVSGGAVLLLLAPALAHGLAFWGGDLERAFAPTKLAWVSAVSDGRLPQWYPFASMGQPFIGMTMTGTFHPINALFLLLPLPMAMTFAVVLALTLGAVGVWRASSALRLSREATVLAVGSFLASGPSLAGAAHLMALVSMQTLPWLAVAALWYAQRPSTRRGLTVSLLWASLALNGDLLVFALATLVVWACAAASRCDSWRSRSCSLRFNSCRPS